METSLDRALPYVKEVIIIYIPVAFLQSVIGFYMISRNTREHCLTLIGAEMIGKLLCLICFLFLPTTMVRADIIGTDLLNRCVGYLYEIDAADNLFPSIHCLESWVVTRGAFRCKKVPKWYCVFCVVITLGIFASTVLVKQHVVVDILGGILVTELGLALAKRFRVGRLFSFLERKKEVDA
jgi:membrane-associated phospholipid phosphatase